MSKLDDWRKLFGVETLDKWIEEPQPTEDEKEEND
jgi:hypothetical protein